MLAVLHSCWQGFPSCACSNARCVCLDFVGKTLDCTTTSCFQCVGLGTHGPHCMCHFGGQLSTHLEGYRCFIGMWEARSSAVSKVLLVSQAHNCSLQVCN